MIRIAVVEDEEQDRALLLGLLERYCAERGTEASLTPFSDGESLLADYPRDLSLLFLDIRMKGPDGIETARRVRGQDKNVLIIFTTNLTQMAVHGYEVEALDFMVKPVRYPQLCSRMDKVLQRLSNDAPQLLAVKCRKNSIYLNRKDLWYCETYEKAVLIHTATGDVPCNETLDQLERRLQKDGRFFRCHRAFLVNLSHVEALQGLTVTVAGHRIPVSKYRKNAFYQSIANYLGGVIQ